jgi:general secretion pathway protein C
VALRLLDSEAMTFHTLGLLPLAALALLACGSTSSPSDGAAASQAKSRTTSPAASPAVWADPTVVVTLSAAPPPPSPRLLAEVRKGIVEKSPSSFDIGRDTLATIFDNQPALMSQARIVPETDQGKVVDVRVFGVTADSLLGTLGIRNGDRVERINGTDMATPDQTFATFASLRNADHFTVALERAGQDMSIEYAVR